MKPCLLPISLTTTAAAADEVYVEMKRKAKDAILELIEKEREGEQIERLLLKNVLDIFMVVGLPALSGPHQQAAVLRLL